MITNIGLYKCYHCSGTTKLLTSRVAPHLDEGSEDPTTLMACNKDTGEKSSGRGGMVCVSGSGHIQMWQPLYKWVFYCDLLSLASLTSLLILIIVQIWGPWTSAFASVDMACSCIWEENQRRLEEGYCELYDNMCHLNNLKVSKRLLPLPDDLIGIHMARCDKDNWLTTSTEPQRPKMPAVWP